MARMMDRWPCVWAIFDALYEARRGPLGWEAQQAFIARLVNKRVRRLNDLEWAAAWRAFDTWFDSNDDSMQDLDEDAHWVAQKRAIEHAVSAV